MDSIRLQYRDKKKASALPGSEEPFRLIRYKEEIDKPYSRITFYLCSCSDYLSSIFNDILTDSDSDHVPSSCHLSIPVDEVTEPNNE